MTLPFQKVVTDSYRLPHSSPFTKICFPLSFHFVYFISHSNGIHHSHRLLQKSFKCSPFFYLFFHMLFFYLECYSLYSGGLVFLELREKDIQQINFLQQFLFDLHILQSTCWIWLQVWAIGLWDTSVKILGTFIFRSLAFTPSREEI